MKTISSFSCLTSPVFCWGPNEDFLKIFSVARLSAIEQLPSPCGSGTKSYVARRNDGGNGREVEI